MGIFVGHMPCENCGGSDPLAVYQNEKGEYDGTCFSCGKYFSNLKPNFRVKKKPMTIESFDFVNELPFRGWRERRVDKVVSELYGVKSKMDGEKVLSRFYPIYTNNILSGYKVRNCVEKDFRSLGIVGKHSQLFGQHLFPNNGKYLVITEGEEDAMSAFAMLASPKYRTPCVSIINGAQSAVEQVRANYNFVSGFEHVIICFDNDAPGQENAEALARILKPGQAKIMKMRLKDANQYLMSGQQKEFTELFWKAERYSPAGIVGSSDTWSALVSRANFVKIGLPKFAEELERMLNGGISLSEITTIFAASGVGKSTITYEFVYHWIFNTDYKVGIISLENDLGELVENLLSIHLNKKLAIMHDESKLKFFETEEAKRAHKELTTLPDGSDRFIILDHQGDMLDGDLQAKMEYLVRVNGCKILILDPMTLALSGRGNESTDQFMAWLVAFVKREQVCHINVVHVRKAQSGTKAGSVGGTIHEEDGKGSSSIFQNSMNNILIMRDKENEDPEVRNTTRVVLSKSRRTGVTGPAGFWKYNNATSRLEKGRDPNGNYEEEEKDFIPFCPNPVEYEDF